MNLGRFGARVGLNAANAWGFLERKGKGLSSDRLFYSLFA